MLTAGVTVLPLTGVDARPAVAVRAELAAVGTPIRPYDLLIAGLARARGAGLRLEDWGGGG